MPKTQHVAHFVNEYLIKTRIVLQQYYIPIQLRKSAHRQLFRIDHLIGNKNTLLVVLSQLIQALITIEIIARTHTHRRQSAVPESSAHGLRAGGGMFVENRLGGRRA